MEKLHRYQGIIKDVLRDYSAQGPIDPNHPERREIRLLFDDEHARYQLLRLGWRDIHNFFAVIFHFEIIDEKIWVQRNMSDHDIIGDIEDKGVPKEDIVLAFIAPRERAYSEYAAPPYP